MPLGLGKDGPAATEDVLQVFDHHQHGGWTQAVLGVLVGLVMQRGRRMGGLVRRFHIWHDALQTWGTENTGKRAQTMAVTNITAATKDVEHLSSTMAKDDYTYQIYVEIEAINV